MPVQVYSIQTRGHNMGGQQRCNSKEEAESIYATLRDAVTNNSPICELELNGSKVCFRTSELTGFGLNVHLEETPEEIKARRIAEIENGGFGYNHAIGYQGQVEAKSCLAGTGLI